MSGSNQVINNPISQISGDLLHKVFIGQDLSGLNPSEQVEYLKCLSLSLGLNPLTKPFEIIKFPKTGKEMPYIRKDGTEQLRTKRNISIGQLETKLINEILYVVTAHAATPEGRIDSSTGVVNISGLKGEELANAMMKAETKAKRRVTLSICGLGFLDESEVESIPSAAKISVLNTPINKAIEYNSFELKLHFAEFKVDIEKCETEDQLRIVFDGIKKVSFKNAPDLFKQLIELKDKKKGELMVIEFNEEIDGETGEVKND